MTVSTHTTTVYLIGSPDVELDFKSGSITLDARSAPHVTANITVSIPSPSVLTGLDPRDSARVRIQTDAVFPAETQSRTFNLGIRERIVDGTDVRLYLESDEALLLDYKPLEDDTTPFTYQDSLRDVIDYVLDTAIAGAALEATPADDEDITTYEDATNIIENPCAAVDLSGWSANGLSSFARSTSLSTPMDNSGGTGFRLDGSAGTSTSYIDYTVPPTAVAGKKFRVRARQFNGAGALTGTSDPNYLRVVVYVSVDDGTGWTEYATSDHGPTTASTIQDHHIIVEFPYATNAVLLRLVHGVQNANTVYWSDVLMSEYNEDPTDSGYWDGSTSDTSEYLYQWSGDTGESASTRTALVDRPKDALLWRAGVSAYDFLLPLFQTAGLRLVCDESRDWTLRNADYLAAGSVQIRYGVNRIHSTDTISRSDDTYFDAAITTYRWRDRNGTTQQRTDSYALNDPYTRATTFEFDTAYPGPGFSQYAVERAQGRGRTVEASKVSDWTVAAEQACSFVLDGAPIQTGKTDRVVFDLDLDEVSITARTIDTPEGAINLLTGTINALAGTINAL